MNDRTCIVTREAGSTKLMIRFVAAPDGTVVPDIKGRLPGRGCWVGADQALVKKAISRNLFTRALKMPVTASLDLVQLVDSLLADAVLGTLGLARKAGAVALGAAKVEANVRSGKANVVLHASEASEDGVRKIANARKATTFAGGPAIPAYKLFSESELSLALGATNVIHAAVLGRGSGEAARRRIEMLAHYRGIGPVGKVSNAADAAEGME